MNRLAGVLLALAVTSVPLYAEEFAAPATAPASAPASLAPQPEGEPDESATEPPRGSEPRIDVLIPEGDFDFRLGRFVKNSLFEGQFKYNFVRGDITAFLRYRYYGFDKTLTFSFFDAVEFEAVEKLSNDFSRVRGALAIVQRPTSFRQRAVLSFEIDRLSSNREELRFSNNRTNMFVRLGYQLGTPRDERSNSIVGESRARVQRLFTAYRDIGPRAAGLTGALTYGFDWLGADFDYIKLELDGLKRFNLPRGLFLVQRAHAGTFLDKHTLRSGPDIEPADRYSTPRSELFRLDGRENLKGLRERLRGTEILLTTSELFVRWFADEDRRALKLHWRSWYWVAYAGHGTVGFGREVLRETGAYQTDVGLGFESSFAWHSLEVFLSGIVAQTLDSTGGPKAKLSLKSFH